MRKNRNKLSTWMISVGVLAGFAIIMAGCNRGKEENVQSNGDYQAYVDESSSEEDNAINTLQVGSQYRIVTPMMELKDAVVEILGDNYWPDALLSEEELAERTGVSANMYENFMAEYQHSEAGIDMMIIVEAKEESLEDVEVYLNDYRELLLNMYEKQPQNKAKVFASRIEVIKNYICYVQLGADIERLESLGEDEMVAYCQQENERALDIIEKRIMSWEE